MDTPTSKNALKAERLRVEGLARDSLAAQLKCNAASAKLAVGSGGPIHEFDVFDEGIVIGGVSTGTFRTSTGKTNTASRDRAAAELLWLSLWQGDETRVHLMTDRPLADWVYQRFGRAPFPCTIDIYHYCQVSSALELIGSVGR